MISSLVRFTVLPLPSTGMATSSISARAGPEATNTTAARATPAKKRVATPRSTVDVRASPQDPDVCGTTSAIFIWFCDSVDVCDPGADKRAVQAQPKQACEKHCAK